MRVAVVGVGGVGGYVGARLAESGADVVFVARGAHLAKIRETGLRVDSPLGNVIVKPTQATDALQDIGHVDCVLLAVKSWQVSEVVARLGPQLRPDAAVVPLQNGIDATDEIARGLGAEHALGALIKIASVRIGPGLIKHLGVDPVIEIGELDRPTSPRVEMLRKLFESAKGIRVTCPPDIVSAMWKKFMFMAAWGGISAVHRAPLGVIRSVPEMRRSLIVAMEEIEHVANAHGVQIADAASLMTYVDSLPAECTSSLQRDIANGAPSELESWVGAVVRRGAAVGVPTPVNASNYQALLPLEAKARRRS